MVLIHSPKQLPHEDSTHRTSPMFLFLHSQKSYAVFYERIWESGGGKKLQYYFKLKLLNKVFLLLSWTKMLLYA